MSYSHYLAVRSIDRINYSTTTSSNFQIQLKQGYGNVIKVKLMDFICPNTFYKIRAGVNNYFVWNRGSTNYSFTITPGAYSIADLLNTIQNQMNSADSNSYVATYNSDTLTTTISGTGAFILNWSSNPHASTSCWRELGWTQADTTSATSQTSPNCYSLERPTRLYITINELLQPGVSTNLGFYTFWIPINVLSGQMIQYKAQDYEQIIQFKSPISISTLTINLTIENNEQASLNGEEWEMMLELTFA
jgi:hypothetical protein